MTFISKLKNLLTKTTVTFIITVKILKPVKLQLSQAIILKAGIFKSIMIKL